MAAPARSRCADFETSLLRLTPQLRRYALSLGADRATADDLVQEAMTRAIASRDRFREGTNLRAWTFTILRNFHFAQWHKSKRLCAWEPGLDEDLEASGGQEAAVALSDVFESFRRLPRLQREALAMVGVAGCTYEQAAELGGCPPGTMKSRVSRARATLVTAPVARRSADTDGFNAFVELSDTLVAGADCLLVDAEDEGQPSP